MQVHGHDIGVCSWSLRPDGFGDLVSRVRDLGLSHMQLALAPLLEMEDAAREDALRTIEQGGVKLTAGMISFPGEDYSSIAIIRNTGGYLPDATWEARKELTAAACALGAAMKLSMISTHVGFVPASSDPAYTKSVDRICEVAELFSAQGITLLMESGQESASELLQFLNDLRTRNVGVNFDPANMILYGAGDPIDAIRILGRHIRHVHVKDAMLSNQPRMKWGTEVPFGTGQVHPRRFLDALTAIGYTGPLVIEREAGADRMDDVRFAIETLARA